jgi:hypothetical protein
MKQNIGNNYYGNLKVNWINKTTKYLFIYLYIISKSG